MEPTTTTTANTAANTTPAIDAQAAAEALSQVAQAQHATAERLIAPRWWYPLQGLFNAAAVLLYADLARLLVNAWLRTDVTHADNLLSTGEAFFVFIAFFTMYRVLILLGRWRRQQIGSDYDIEWGMLKPRNAVMWLMLGVAVVAWVTTAALLIWWAYQAQHQAEIPVLPQILAVIMGFAAWWSEYQYDRYYAHTVERGL